MSDFDSSETGSSILPNGSLYSGGNNISKLPEKEGNILKRQEQNRDDLNDLESELSEPPKEPLLEPPEEPLEIFLSAQRIYVDLAELELLECFIRDKSAMVLTQIRALITEIHLQV